MARINRKIPDISLVMPCYNEEASIGTTAPALAKCFSDRGIDLELVLVDNGSRDRTGELIDELIARGLPITKVTVPVNQGYGYGVLQGLRRCSGRFAGFVCADGQVDAEDVVRIYEVAARASSPVLVKARRRFRMDGFVRKLVSIIYNGMTTVLFGGLGSIDINGNPKIFPAEMLEEMKLVSKDWFLDAEVMIKAKYLGLKVIEINVFARMREGGSTNVKPQTCLEFLKNIGRYRFGSALREWQGARRVPAGGPLADSAAKSK